MSTTPSSILSFPTAPADGGCSFVIQKGVRYIGRVETDGPAVWEAICDALGMDSQNDAIAGLASLFNVFLQNYLASLPTVDTGVKGAPFLDGNFVAVDTDGAAGPAGLDQVPPLLQGIFRGAIEAYIAALPVGPLTGTTSLNGNFINVDKT